MGLVSNSITGKVEYLIDLEGGGGAKQSTLLSITTAPSGSFEKGSQYYNSNTRLIYTAVEDNTWTDAKTSDPEFGTIYVCDNSGTDVKSFGSLTSGTHCFSFLFKNGQLIHQYAYGGSFSTFFSVVYKDIASNIEYNGGTYILNSISS